MKEVPKYVIRISCNDLTTTEKFYIAQGFSLVAREDNLNSWIAKENLTLCLVQSAADSPCLVSYWEKPDEAIRTLEELGVIFNFSADSQGNHFEAHFTDPAGLPLVIADSMDLPKEISIENFPGELVVPSSLNFQDSVNFWHSIGFKIQPSGAQPHAWSVLNHGAMTVGIHQSMNWEKPGLCFRKESCPFNTETVELDIRVYSKVNIGQTIDGCRYYSLGE